MNEMLEITYVYRAGVARWRVSTMNRQSSALITGELVYAETMVFDELTHRIAGQTECCKDSLRGHDMMVRRLRETDSPDDPEGDA